MSDVENIKEVSNNENILKIDLEAIEKNEDITIDLKNIVDKNEQEGTLNELVSDDNTINKSGGDGVTTFYLRKADDETNAKELVPAIGEDSKKTPEEQTNPNTEVPIGKEESECQNEDVSEPSKTQSNFQSNIEGHNNTNNGFKSGKDFYKAESSDESKKIGPYDFTSIGNFEQFDISDCYQNLGDFQLKGKLVRDTVAKQCIFIQSCLCKAKNSEQKESKNSVKDVDESDQHPGSKKLFDIFRGPGVKEPTPDVVKVGIIGAGLMGKLIYQILNGKTLHGQKQEISISTRVPEKMFKETLKGGMIFFDNARIVKENDVVFICAPKHCCNYIFADILEEYKKQVAQKRKVLIYSIVGNLSQQKLQTYLNCDQNSLTLTARVDYEIIEKYLQQLKEVEERNEFIDITQISDYAAFECLFNKKYLSRVWEVTSMLSKKSSISLENQLTSGVLQLLKSNDEILNKHFYRNLNGENAKEKKKLESRKIENDSTSKVFDTNFQKFSEDKDFLQKIFMEPIQEFRNTVLEGIDNITVDKAF